MKMMKIKKLKVQSKMGAQSLIYQGFDIPIMY